jgi:hypothetical protein
MRQCSSSRSARMRFAASMLALLLGMPGQEPNATEPVPSAVASLLPDQAKLEDSGWMRADTVIMGDIAASFPGKPRRCLSSRGSELKILINGNSSYDDYMVEFALGLQAQNIAQSREGLANAARLQKEGSMDALDVVSVGDVITEDFEGGHIVYHTFVENCATRSNATVARMNGFARNGTTFLEFNLSMTTGLEDAKAAAAQIFERFRALDASGL